MKNNKWPAQDEKPDAFVQKQKDDLEDIANTIFFALDIPPINTSKPIPDRTNNDGWFPNHETDKNENK